MMDNQCWVDLVRLAGLGHIITVALAHWTPIPRDWEAGLRRLSDVHRRFALAQDASMGAIMLAGAVVSVTLAPRLVSGDVLARVICAAFACWWGARWALLPWLRVRTELVTPGLRLGFVVLRAECAAFALGYGWLAVR